MSQNDENFSTSFGAAEDDTSSASFAAEMSGGGEEGFYIASDAKKKPAGATLAVAGLVVVAAGGLWMMRQRTGGPASANADPTTVAAQESIRQFLSGGKSEVDEMKDLLADTAAIKERFEQANTDRQIPLDDLKTNPFWHETPDEEDETEQTLSRQQEERLLAEKKRKEEEAREKAEAEAGRLELASIFLGSRPSCLINGSICRIGTNVEGFTVVAIRHGEIDVRRDDFTFTLKLTH